MGKKQLASQSLKKITDFKPKIENTVRNFLPANHLITAWAIGKMISKKDATQWLNEEAKKYPDNKIIQWCKQSYDNGSVEADNGSDLSIRLIQQLSQLE